MFKLALPTALALVAGSSVVIQQVLNANLRAQLNSAIWSGFISYAVGVLCMLSIAIMLREPIPSSALVTRIPWWAWTGGLFGAIFIGISILVTYQLGAAALIGLLVTGNCVCHDGSLWMVWAAAKADRFSPADRRRSSNRSRDSDPTLSGHHRSDILRQVGPFRNGAGEGNRTLVISLEGCCSTIELHPHQGCVISSQ